MSAFTETDKGAGNVLHLYTDQDLASPYVMSVFVALTEKGLPFELHTVDLTQRAQYAPEYVAISTTRRVPTLTHGEFVLSESSAITEYLEDLFPDHAIYPKNPQQRATARLVQAWLRSDFLPIRAERDTEVVFYGAQRTALSDEARRSVDKLVAGVARLLPDGAQNLFGEYCIADTDLAMMLMRLVAHGDDVPAPLRAYAIHQWQRASVQALEVAHRVDTVAFDKTGTLTVGQPRLVALELAAGADEAAVLAAVAGVQSGSEHPLARAVVAAAAQRGMAPEAADGVRAVPGRGTEGVVQGQTWHIGSLRWMQELGVPVLPAAAGEGAANAGPLALRALALQQEGFTVSAVAGPTPQGLQVLALLAFGDEPKPGAREALAALKARGIRTVMISGDNRGAAEAMARRLGLDPAAGEVMAEVLPGDKAAMVAALQQGPDEGRSERRRAAPRRERPLGGQRPSAAAERGGHVVAMVGDGVNDAPALAAADVGMAMGNGTDVAMHAAGITLMRGDPMLVAAALDISRRTVAKIRQNLFWAFFYNVAGIPLAALGYLNPVVAGAAMALSSVSVMANALLLKRWRM